MARHDYHLEIKFGGRWVRRAGSLVSRRYGEGYLDRHRETPPPRAAMRLVFERDGQVEVVQTVTADMRASVGQTAGSVTWRQYLRAGLRVLEGAQAVLPLSVEGKWLAGMIESYSEPLRGLLNTDTINKLEG